MSESVDTVGLFDPTTGTVLLCDRNSTGPPAMRFPFGPFSSATRPVAGDWNGDGLAGIALHCPHDASFRYRESNDGRIGHRSFLFGPVGGVAISGDWTGRGADGVGVYDRRESIFHFKDAPTTGEADRFLLFGGSDAGATAIPFSGRFAPDSPPGDSVGLYDPRSGTFFLKTSLESGEADIQFQFGPRTPGLLPIAGDWAGQGFDTVGLFDPTECAFYLRFKNAHGHADAQFTILDEERQPGAGYPVAGRFAGIQGDARPLSIDLDADSRLRSQLWVDQAHAREELDLRCEQSPLGVEIVPRVEEFLDQGYTVLHHPRIAELAAELEQDLERIWSERPRDLLLFPAGYTKGIPFSDTPRRAKKTNWRIPDLHSHSNAAMQIYLSDMLNQFAELIFGEPAVAIQSLYFPKGSEQALHRDPMFVVTEPPSHMLAAWVALEDITPDSGPLAYLPGSHRLPYVPNSAGGVSVPINDEADQIFARLANDLMAQSSDYNLSTEKLICRQGDVLFWHGSLVHGGSPILNPDATRKSFVIHYSTEAHYPERISNYRTVERRFFRTRTAERIARTRRLVGEGASRGVDNPLRGR